MLAPGPATSTRTRRRTGGRRRLRWVIIASRITPSAMIRTLVWEKRTREANVLTAASSIAPRSSALPEVEVDRRQRSGE